MDVVPLEGPVKIQEEEDRLRLLIQAGKFPHQTEILKHLTDATDLYTEQGKEHLCQNECRSFFQAVLDDTTKKRIASADIRCCCRAA
jgi:hypothetical protein